MFNPMRVSDIVNRITDTVAKGKPVEELSNAEMLEIMKHSIAESIQYWEREGANTLRRGF